MLRAVSQAVDFFLLRLTFLLQHLVNYRVPTRHPDRRKFSEGVISACHWQIGDPA